MAGHSHWAKIKRAKASTDSKRGKVWSKIARKLIIAARAGGGDPAANLSLRYVIEEARGANMPKDTIEKAIAKGTGELGAENFEAVTYEGYGPGGVAILVEALTNNRARTAPEMRKIFENHGGKMSGGVAHQFTRHGLIAIKREVIEEDRLLELALEAGADDVRTVAEGYEVITAPTALHRVRDAITAAGVAVEDAQVVYSPSSTVPVDGTVAQQILKLADALEDNEDVQNVWHNADLPEG